MLVFPFGVVEVKDVVRLKKYMGGGRGGGRENANDDRKIVHSS